MSHFEYIQAQVLNLFPDAVIDVETFDSGALMIDIRLDGRLFVCAYSPSSGFGVDEVGDSDGFDSTFRHAAENVEDAMIKLLELMRS